MKTNIDYTQIVSITHIFGGTSMEAMGYLNTLAKEFNVSSEIEEFYNEDTIEIRVIGTLENVFNYLTELRDEDEAYEMLEEYFEED